MSETDESRTSPFIRREKRREVLRHKVPMCINVYEHINGHRAKQQRKENYREIEGKKKVFMFAFCGVIKRLVFPYALMSIAGAGGRLDWWTFFSHKTVVDCPLSLNMHKTPQQMELEGRSVKGDASVTEEERLVETSFSLQIILINFN